MHKVKRHTWKAYYPNPLGKAEYYCTVCGAKHHSLEKKLRLQCYGKLARHFKQVRSVT